MNIFSDVQDISKKIGVKLIDNGITVSFAESCTAGLATASLADVAGISGVLIESIVTYSNDAKVRLGVLRDTIEKYGAVSSQTAIEMAQCIRKRSGSDFGISVTGIAGPGGGTDEKPVGLVYIALCTKNGTKVKKLSLNGSRTKIRCESVINIMKFIEEGMNEK